MVPRIEYIKKRINWFKKYVPKMFHMQITIMMFEIYGQAVNYMDYDTIMRSIHRGGGIEKTHTVEINGYTFKVSVEKNDNDILIKILTYKESNPESCANISVDQKSGIAILGNISYHEGCGKPIQLGHTIYRGMPENPTGSMILKFILKFLKKNKKALNINRIVLTDNSYKICKRCNDIKLSNLNLLLYGDTWYGKYGFRPYDNNKNAQDKKGIKKYNKNKQIIKQTLVKDVNLIDYIKRGIFKYKLYHIDSTILIEKIKEWQDHKLSDVLIALMKEYDKYCCLFEYIQEKLINELNILSFHHMPFYLDI